MLPITRTVDGRLEAGWAEALRGNAPDLRDELDFPRPMARIAESEPAAVAPVADGSGASRCATLAAIDAEQAIAACPTALLAQGAAHARERIAAIDELIQQAGALAQVDYGFLFDKVRRQFVIGYNVGDARTDASYYDLLASEARLANFVAIAQGKLPQESWFALGRLLTSAGGEPVLLSWSGSMFEYLMPLLVMPTYENTLLDQTYIAAVERQIEYGRQRGVPWGVSECGYNAVDAHDNYQYRAFGVPGLGLKRGLADDLVIAPVCLGAGADGGARGRVREPAKARRGRNVWALRDVRSDRLHAITPAARRVEQHRAVIHGASPWNESARVFACAARTGRCRSGSSPIRWFKATLLLLQERIPRATPFYATATIAPDLAVGQGERRATDPRAGDAATHRCPKCICCPTAATT